MKKIISLFQRNHDGDRLVRDEMLEKFLVDLTLKENEK